MDAADYDYRAGLRSSLGIFAFLTVARLAFNLLITGKPGPGADSRSASAKDKNVEEAWLGIGTFWLVAWSWWALWTSGSECGVLNTRACVEDWPDIPVSRRVTGLFEAEIGWYMHMLTRGLAGVGFAQEPSMAVHHTVTLCLILTGYTLNIMRFGVLMLAVFNLSNPFLHISKVANNLEMARTRVALFSLFGVMFFASRVVLLPATVMRCTFYEVLVVLEREPHMWRLYYPGNFLIVGLYIMQLFWMVKIIRVLFRGRAGATPRKVDGVKGPFQQEKLSKGGDGIVSSKEK
ncbi:unnamed protein product [Ostreobium quekettii]|uniref:TLC domain-containing protein n=1 Tax=Ostreobium quekettii TaxID=121088 RepID=A0A8S1J1L0_9CHLO|nr:unnamed protein product [Ostreobium quekettii]|eukprot:evm.model.scf_1063.5 EVM.evm.TU.scf_1063.5   scf_1063:36341-37213(-)